MRTQECVPCYFQISLHIDPPNNDATRLNSTLLIISLFICSSHLLGILITIGLVSEF